MRIHGTSFFRRLMAGFCFLLFGCTALSAQTIITQWNFNGPSGAVPGGVSSPSPVTGTGSLSLIGGATAVFNSGLLSTDSEPTYPPNNSWQTSSYPALGLNEKTAGIEILMSTAGYNSISLVFDQRLSNTSANTWVVFYTTDVTVGSPVWQQAQIFTFTPDPTTTGDRWYNQRSVDFSAISALNDNPNAAFKIVSAFDPVAGNYLASRSTSTYATSGNARYDMVAISGVPIVIVQNLAPTITSSTISGNLNVGDTLTASYNYSDTEGDAEGISIYKWFRADDANGLNETEIAGADTLVYALTAGDLNKFISFEVTPVALTGTSPGSPTRTSYQGPIDQSLEILLYPSPFDLSTGNFSFQSWPSGSTPESYPANMTFQQFSQEPDSKNMKPVALWKCTYNGTSRSRMLGLDSDGIGFLNTSDPQDTETLCGNGTERGGYIGTAVLAINTTALSSLTLSWATALRIQGSGTPAREYRLMPQYKIAGSAVWTDFGPQYEFSSANAQVDQVNNFSVVLPQVLEGLPNVFIRWIYYQTPTGNSGSRPEISLDEISVAVPGAPNAAPVASGITVQGLMLVSQSLTANYQYTDAEGDAAATPVIVWYRADDAAGSNSTVISGASSLSFTPTVPDATKYFAIKITPTAQTGTVTGLSVLSDYVGPILNFGDPSVIKINELYSRGSDTSTNPDLRTDWVEFYNSGAVDVTLAGLQLCDDGQCQTLPMSAATLLTIPAGGFLALSQNDPNSFTFGLSSLGEYLILRRPDNHVRIDSINFPALDDTQSYGRFQDGTARITTLIPPTRGLTNNTATPGDVTGIPGEKQKPVALFPIPAKNEITLVNSEANPVQTLSIFSMTGQEVSHTAVFSKTIQISLSGIACGIYLVRITHQDGLLEVRKIVKE